MGGALEITVGSHVLLSQVELELVELTVDRLAKLPALLDFSDLAAQIDQGIADRQVLVERPVLTEVA
jgi:hypothetical protein